MKIIKLTKNVLTIIAINVHALNSPTGYSPTGFKKNTTIYCVLLQRKREKYKDKKIYHIWANINQNKIVLVTTTFENGEFKVIFYKDKKCFIVL